MAGKIQGILASKDTEGKADQFMEDSSQLEDHQAAVLLEQVAKEISGTKDRTQAEPKAIIPAETEAAMRALTEAIQAEQDPGAHPGRKEELEDN